MWARDSSPGRAPGTGPGERQRLLGTKLVCSVLAPYHWLFPVTPPVPGNTDQIVFAGLQRDTGRNGAEDKQEARSQSQVGRSQRADKQKQGHCFLGHQKKGTWGRGKILVHKAKHEMLDFGFTGLLPVTSLSYFIFWELSLVSGACEPRVAECPSPAEETGGGERRREAETQVAPSSLISFDRGCCAKWASAWPVPSPSAGPQGLNREPSPRARGSDPLES